MAFRPSASHKRPRWLTLFAIVMLATLALASSALAAPSFTFDADDDGPNDEPGQKDLTAQSSAFDGADFYTAWLWDDLSWSGGNTGDGCSLFDNDADGKVNFAVCATIGGETPALESVTVYQCSDKKIDRCTGPTLLLAQGSDGDCDITNDVNFVFGSDDTQATCNISALAATDEVPDVLDNGTLVNTCSYPSQEPNSDPSDCVKTITNLNTTVGTLSSGTTTWTATLNDTATLNPTTATGSVVFKLWQDSSCTVSQWVSTSVNLGAGGTASTVGAGTASGTNVITDATVDADGIYYWTVDYTPTGAFNASSHACGETTTITPATVAGGSN